MRKYQPASKIMIKPCTGFKEETCYDNPFYVPDEAPYKDIVLEHVSDCLFFRKNFIGNSNHPFLTPDHQMFAGTLEKWGPVIISLLKEENFENPKSLGEKETIYKVILRFKEVFYGVTIATGTT